MADAQISVDPREALHAAVRTFLGEFCRRAEYDKPPLPRWKYATYGDDSMELRFDVTGPDGKRVKYTARSNGERTSEAAYDALAQIIAENENMLRDWTRANLPDSLSSIKAILEVAELQRHPRTAS